MASQPPPMSRLVEVTPLLMVRCPLVIVPRLLAEVAVEVEAGAVVVDVEAAGVAVVGVVVVVVAAGVVVAGVVVVVDVDGVVSDAVVSSRFLRPPSPRLLSARCSCSAVSAIAVSICAISSAVAFPLFALSSSACIASICAFNASISGSVFLVQPVTVPMISIIAITGISLLVIICSLC